MGRDILTCLEAGSEELGAAIGFGKAPLLLQLRLKAGRLGSRWEAARHEATGHRRDEAGADGGDEAVGKVEVARNWSIHGGLQHNLKI